MSEAASTQRNWLEHLLKEHGGHQGQDVQVTDAGYDFRDGSADLVYEFDGGRFEITIKELPHD